MANKRIQRPQARRPDNWDCDVYNLPEADALFSELEAHLKMALERVAVMADTDCDPGLPNVPFLRKAPEPIQPPVELPQITRYDEHAYRIRGRDTCCEAKCKMEESPKGEYVEFREHERQLLAVLTRAEKVMGLNAELTTLHQQLKDSEQECRAWKDLAQNDDEFNRGVEAVAEHFIRMGWHPQSTGIDAIRGSKEPKQ